MTSSKTLVPRYLPLAIASLLQIPASQAATVGQLAVRLNTGQAFVAEAQLSPSAGENPANLSVRLAAPDKFDENGIAWRYEFSQLRFQTQTQIDGSKLIRISSDSYWPQSRLDLVLEIISPGGSQFTKLGAELVRPIVATAKPLRKSGFDATSLSQDQSSYGPIRASDTLWSIAKHLAHQHGVSTQKMLETLQKNNPDAFNHGSINSLKPGVSLKITPPEPKPEPISEPSTTIPTSPSQESKALDLVAPVTTTEANPNSASDIPVSGEGDYLFLQTRVETLEQQIGMMQQLLTLKDQQLNQLQGNVEQQLSQQTQLVALSLFSSLLAAISISLGWLLWRKRPQTTPSEPAPQKAKKQISSQPQEALASRAAPVTETAPVKNNPAFDMTDKDEFDFDFDLSPGSQRAQDNNSTTDDWTTADDQESKIDLARAYFDMGDVDMAKEMANQVLKNGNKDQQNLAKILLDEIAQPNI